MSDRSRIEWTDATWNPVTGCAPVSAGCAYCYARRFAERFRGVKGHAFEHGFDFTLRPERLEIPLRWTRPRKIFVCSMGDLFHPDVPADFIYRVFMTMAAASQHTFQVLTKRPQRAADIAAALPWPDNLWFGTTVESAREVHRVDDLRHIPAKVRFLSHEPLLGPISVSLEDVNWVIVGGETGPGHRFMMEWWVQEIRDRCVDNLVQFFFKGWGGHRRYDRMLEGRTWEEFPA